MVGTVSLDQCGVGLYAYNWEGLELFFLKCVSLVGMCLFEHTCVVSSWGFLCVHGILVSWVFCAVLVSVSVSSESRVKWQVSWRFRSRKSLLKMCTLDQRASYVLGTVRLPRRGGTSRSLGTGVPDKALRGSKPGFSLPSTVLFLHFPTLPTIFLSYP